VKKEGTEEKPVQGARLRGKDAKAVIHRRGDTGGGKGSVFSGENEKIRFRS